MRHGGFDEGIFPDVFEVLVDLGFGGVLFLVEVERVACTDCHKFGLLLRTEEILDHEVGVVFRSRCAYQDGVILKHVLQKRSDARTLEHAVSLTRLASEKCAIKVEDYK